MALIAEACVIGGC